MYMYIKKLLHGRTMPLYVKVKNACSPLTRPEKMKSIKRSFHQINQDSLSVTLDEYPPGFIVKYYVLSDRSMK